MDDFVSSPPSIENTTQNSWYKGDKITLNLFDRNMLKVQINGKSLHGLVDSGSDFTLVGESFFVKFPELIKCVSPCSQFVSSVSASTFKLVGKLDLHLQISNSIFKIQAFVSPRTPWDLLLGVDFLRKFDVKIDFQTDVLKIPKHINIFCENFVTVPPFSEKIIQCNLTRKTPADISGTITGKNILHKKGMLCANAYVTVKKGTNIVPVRVANLTSQKQVLQPKTRLAYFVLAEGTETLLDFEHSPNSSQLESSSNLNKRNYVNSAYEVASNNANSNVLDFSFDESSLSSEQKTQLLDVLNEFDDVFKKPNQPLGCTSVLKHKIKLIPGSEPFRSVPYRMTPIQRNEVGRQLDEMLKQGICSESESPFSSPVILVKKADGSLRFVVDMRKLNTITVKDSFPIIRIDDCLDCLGGSKYFATMDLESGFWQVELDEDLTSFVTFDGLYRFDQGF